MLSAGSSHALPVNAHVYMTRQSSRDALERGLPPESSLLPLIGLNSCSTPIWKRPVDLGFVLFFVFALFFAVMMDCVNALVPTGPITQSDLDSLTWPPKFMRDTFMWWCEYADTLLLHNPLWYQTVCALSPYVYAPFYLAAIYAFIKESEWIRPWCLMWSGALIMTMLPVYVYTVIGDSASPRPLVFFAAYGSFIAVPVLLFVRMYREGFPRPRSPRSQAYIVHESVFNRLDDFMFLLSFMFFIFVSLTLDVIPLLVSEGQMRKNAIYDLAWPPSEHVRKLYYAWIQDVDHVGLRNELWYLMSLCSCGFCTWMMRTSVPILP